MRTRTILAVEDNQSHAALLTGVFAIGMPEANVRIAASGRDAMAYLEGEWPYDDRRRNPLPDVIVLDLWLPDTTGLDVLEWIAADERFADIPVIMLSSSNERRHAQRAFALGARRYVFKPTGFQQLASTVQQVLRQWFDDERDAQMPSR